MKSRKYALPARTALMLVAGNRLSQINLLIEHIQ
jgi:hypothetical protein